MLSGTIIAACLLLAVGLSPKPGAHNALVAKESDCPTCRTPVSADDPVPKSGHCCGKGLKYHPELYSRATSKGVVIAIIKALRYEMFGLDIVRGDYVAKYADDYFGPCEPEEKCKERLNGTEPVVACRRAWNLPSPLDDDGWYEEWFCKEDEICEVNSGYNECVKVVDPLPPSSPSSPVQVFDDTPSSGHCCGHGLQYHHDEYQEAISNGLNGTDDEPDYYADGDKVKYYTTGMATLYDRGTDIEGDYFGPCEDPRTCIKRFENDGGYAKGCGQPMGVSMYCNKGEICEKNFLRNRCVKFNRYSPPPPSPPPWTPWTESYNSPVSPGACTWRNTGECDPSGPREPGNDGNCNELIVWGRSGYCECHAALAGGPQGKAGRKTCDGPALTCAGICGSAFQLWTESHKPSTETTDIAQETWAAAQ